MAVGEGERTKINLAEEIMWARPDRPRPTGKVLMAKDRHESGRMVAGTLSGREKVQCD